MSQQTEADLVTRRHNFLSSATHGIGCPVLKGMDKQQHLSNVKRIVALAMREPDVFVVQMTYEDKKGNRTRRVISPTKFDDQFRFSALCLCREQVRSFYFTNVESVVLQHSEDVLMPVEIEKLPRLSDAPFPDSSR